MNLAVSNMPEVITAWTILAEGIKPLKNEELIRWLLITTILVNSFDKAFEKV